MFDCRTHYTPGQGSCGITSSSTDDVVGESVFSKILSLAFLMKAIVLFSVESRSEIAD